MAKSNYEIMRDRMEVAFLDYDQNSMIKKYGLSHNADYLYISFIGRAYRVSRKTGRVEWSLDGFQTANHADYDDSMTIFDVLCYAKEGCRLSGSFVPLNHLKGTVKGVFVGSDMFCRMAKRFEHRGEVLSEICERLGGQKEAVGDVAYRLWLFDFLPIVLQFWDSDEDFPPVLKIMWDENLLDFMHYETAYYVASHLWKRMMELLEDET